MKFHISNFDLDNVDCTVEKGIVSIKELVGGDINGDGETNGKDGTILLRYLAGWDVEVNEAALDCNGSGSVNNKDATRLLRFLAKWDVELYCNGELYQYCSHTDKTAVAAKAATCTEAGNIAYWYCPGCSKYFTEESCSNKISQEDTVIEATGHTWEEVAGKDPTYEEEGLTTGYQCSVCGEWDPDRMQETIPPLEHNKYYVKYELAGTDSYLVEYLKTVDESTINPNLETIDTTYSSYELDPISKTAIPGYEFTGWINGYDETVRTIDQGMTGSVTLYATWQKTVYTVSFDSPDISVTGSKITGEALTNKTEYTVDQGVTFDNPPSYFGYTFVGWSNDDGFIVNRIKPGTTGNITLHANWTSNRNKAVSYDSYGEPIIIEDDENGQFLFVYNIGRIENVPLKVQKDPWNSDGVSFKETVEVSNAVDETFITGINEMISTATTESSGWTLSEEWNDLYSSTEEVGTLSEKSDKRTSEDGTVVGGKYFVSNSNGGSTYVSSESGGSSSTSSKITTDTSVGINSSYDKQTEKYCDAKLGVTNTTEVGVGAEIPIDFVDLSAEFKNTTTISAEVSSGRKDNTAFHIDGSYSNYVGTVDTSESSNYYNSSISDSSNWNSSTGYEESSELLHTEGVESAIKEQISQTTNHSISKALGGENSTTAEKQETEMSANEYSTSFTYDKGTETTTEKTLEFTASGNGYYRIVTAGTVHVYAVVGYDVATASYYTYCYNVLDDTTTEYLDFSKDTASFDDCENGVVTFEVPYEVNEYIAGAVGKTDGLEISDEGEVTDFEPGENFDGTVVIPQYESKDNDNGTYSAVKVTSFASTAFKKAKDDIEVVILPAYITEIPDSAFEGCSNLKTVIAYGVNKIGNYAFKGCTSLTNFYVDNAVESLGTNAFENVPEVAITAYDSKVADAAVGCGALNITLNLSKIKDTYENKVIEIANTVTKFKLIGNGGTYNNIQVISSAKETVINSMVFANNTDTPLVLNSEKVTLARMTVENAPAFAFVSKAENVDFKLLGTVTLNSASENAILSKNVTLSKADSSTTSKIVTNGKYLVYGTVTNAENYVSVTPEEITQTEFEQYTEGNTVQFVANGGEEITTTVSVYYGKLYGSLPVPIRTGHRFEGWFTAEEGGTKITEESYVLIPGDHTLYAQWVLDEFTLYFDANGGTVDEESRKLICGNTFDTLPTPERYGYVFDGWFTVDGVQITAETTLDVAEDLTVYAHWSLEDIIITFDANGGTVSTESITVYYGDVLSDLPVPTKTGFSFVGWFTEDDQEIKDGDVLEYTDDLSVTAKWSADAYTVSWETGTGYSITVKRTSSPNAGAATGTLSSGDAVYYGDVLSVTYKASTGYSLATKGATSIVVSGNVTSSDIYATASAKSYTYNIVYQSSNGTSLGTGTATYKYGTSNTISPKTFSGYTSPAKQTVKWDSTSAKTITFTYTPKAVSNSTVSGTYQEGTSYQPYMYYSIAVSYQNRTETSVEVKLTPTITQSNFDGYSYGVAFDAACGSAVGGCYAAKAGELYSAGSTSSRSTSWITVPLSTTNATTLTFTTNMYDTNYNNEYFSGGTWISPVVTVNIPAY